MAQYDVTHACGHSETHRLVGKHQDRVRKQDWLAEQPCTACRRQELKAEGPKFLARALPAVDPDAIRAQADALQGQIDWHRRAYERQVAKVRNRWGDEAVSKIEAGSQTYSTDLHGYAIEARRQWRTYVDKADALRREADRATARPARIEIACYANSYEIRDALKQRGYRFSENCPRPSTGDLKRDMMYGTGKGWSLITPEAGVARRELDWIAEQGYQIAGQNAIERPCRAIIEGRSDLLG